MAASRLIVALVAAPLLGACFLEQKLDTHASSGLSEPPPGAPG